MRSKSSSAFAKAMSWSIAAYVRNRHMKRLQVILAHHFSATHCGRFGEETAIPNHSRRYAGIRRYLDRLNATARLAHYADSLAVQPLIILAAGTLIFER